LLEDRIRQYWANRVLYTWGTYEEMRKLRYEAPRDYMLEVFEFDKFRNMSVLELGCGGGIDAAEFARNGAIVTATDFTEEAIDTTMMLAEGLGLNIGTRVADACNLPFEDDLFDHIHAFGVLHHIPDAEKAVREAHRVLKKGGTIYAMLYHRHSLLYYLSIIFMRGILQENLKLLSENELLSRFSEAKNGCPYTKAHTQREALNLFRLFPTTRIGVHYNVFDLPMQRKIKFDGPSHLGWHLVVKARK